MSRLRKRTGESRFGCILWLIAVAVFALVAWRVVPVKIQTSEFLDFLDDQAKFSARATEEQIRGRVLKRAKELDIPLDPKRLVVERGSRHVRIEARYEIPLVFPFYTYVWEFEQIVDRPIFII